MTGKILLQGSIPVYMRNEDGDQPTRGGFLSPATRDYENSTLGWMLFTSHGAY